MITNACLRFVLLIVASVAAVGLLVSPAESKPWWMRGTDSNDNDFLPPDVAFRAGAGLDDQVVRVRWVIADGYYLYRQKIQVTAESPDLVVGAPRLPPGVMKTDPYLGRQEIYTQQVEAQVPYTRRDFGAHPIQVKVTYQGCAEAGLCYPPITKVMFASAALPQPVVNAPRRWEMIALVGGLLAFLTAGLALRRGRKLALPAQ
jgi:thiol:disulfide interchange protein DsbD